MNFFYLPAIFFFPLIIYAQDNIYHFENFNITITQNRVSVSSINDSILYERVFSDMIELTNDLDLDGNSEFIIFEKDSSLVPGYLVYVFNTLDDFFLIDSIIAGQREPSIITPAEIPYPLILCGNQDFEIFFSNGSENYVPINLWKLEHGELYLANEEVYDIFITENESLLNYISGEMGSKKINCDSAKPIISAIASAYANFINAGETASAIQVIKKYYACSDFENFKQTIDELLFIREE